MIFTNRDPAVDLSKQNQEKVEKENELEGENGKTDDNHDSFILQDEIDIQAFSETQNEIQTPNLNNTLKKSNQKKSKIEPQNPKKSHTSKCDNSPKFIELQNIENQPRNQSQKEPSSPKAAKENADELTKADKSKVKNHDGTYVPDYRYVIERYLTMKENTKGKGRSHECVNKSKTLNRVYMKVPILFC